MPANRSQISLRPATAEDEGFLRRVYADSRKAELAQVAWPEGVLDAFLRSQFDAQDKHYRQHYTGADFLIIEFDGAPAGRLYVHRGSGDIRIVDIALVETARGRGIGTLLLQEILDEGQATARNVSIHVEKFNPAYRLYERLGFQIAGDLEVYWLMHRAPAAASAARASGTPD